MKRAALDSSPGANKRLKHDKEAEKTDWPADDSGPFRASLQRKASDIPIHGVDDTGFIQAKILMKWPVVGGRVRVEVSVNEDAVAKHFYVVFAGPCPAFFNSIGMKFAIGDNIRLSLQDVTVEQVIAAQPKFLPMQLHYDQGVRMQVLGKKASAATLVDYWQVKAQKEATALHRAGGNAPISQDWFSTPSVPMASSISWGSGKPDDTSAYPVKALLVTEVGQPEHREKPPSRASSHPKVSPPPFAERITRQSTSSSAEVVKELEKDASRVASEASSRSRSRSSTNEPISERMSKKAEKAARRHAARALRDQASSIQTTSAEGQRDSASVCPNGQIQDFKPEFVEGSSRTSIPSAAPSESISAVMGRKSTSAQPEAKARSVSLASASRATSPKTDVTASEQLTPGFVSERGLPYTPFGDLAANNTCHVVGVVASILPASRTKSGEWSKKVALVDPSNVNDDDLTRGFNINCFTKTQKDNLPDAKVGDILLMRGVKICEWHGGMNGVCPSYKMWSWSLYDPKTGSTKHGGTMISAAGSDIGAVNSSFATAAATNRLDVTETQYCIRLDDWWTGVNQEYETRMGKSIVIQIGGESASIATTTGGKREHRLIKDAHPSAPPGGFFDCTVEILHGHRSSDRIYSLYVTDYTSNEGLSVIDANWCRPSLANMVLRMETWFDAADYAETEMKKGDYFFLGNARMKMDALGYMEGTISDVRKFHRLDVDELEDSPHLAELLSRKAKWELENEAAGTHEFPHRLIRDASAQQHFKCTVHVLSISDKEDRTYLYVTDYTSRPDLVPVHVNSQITRVLENNQILKIALFDEQAKLAAELSAGDYIAIKNLRLRPARAGMDGDLVGKLGGDERLIFKLQPKVSANEDLQELLERKRALEEAHRAKEAGANRAKTARRKKTEPETKLKASSTPEERPPTESKKIPSANGKKPLRPLLIKKILAHERHPCRFRTIARVVDFWPKELEDCVGMYCTGCEKDISSNLIRCPDCDDDMVGTHVVPRFRFFFQLEDEEGDVLQVGVDKHCKLLEDLEPADYREEAEAFEEFKARLEPIIGELASNHDSIVKDGADFTTPWLDITIGCWKSEETNEKEYILMDCMVLEDD